ncbi:AMP-binding protein [Streptomyces roseolus]|uniref:AMP-binding protein n=1 Tax=Streptomyces roseolus TaxID=67358 RepID=UPI00378D5B7E
MPDLVTFLRDTAARHPERPALRQDGDSRTYTDLDRQSARVASLLRARGVRKGDRVAVMLPNVPDFVAVHYGILRAGAVVVPTNPLMKEREVAYCLEDSGAALVFAWHDGPALTAARVAVEPTAFAGLLAEHAPLDSVVPVAAEDIAVILYTSGATGKPKEAALTHGGLAHHTAANATRVQRLSAHDVILGSLPLFHIFGQTCAMNSAVYSGASLVLLPRSEAATALELIASERRGTGSGPRRPVPPSRTGWLRTGDLARRDEDGYFFVVGRKKDLSTRGGCNVYPREIEEVLHEHPDVARAAVIGVPDMRLGEEIAAAVVLRPGGETSPDELRAFVKDRVAPYKYPRRTRLVDALPMGPSGKILKRALTGPTSCPVPAPS